MYKATFLNKYQSLANQTAVYPGRMGDPIETAMAGLFYVSLGLSGEIGELQEKVLCGDTDDLIKKELGDVYWYVSQVCMELGTPMSYLLKTKIDYKKLRSITSTDAIVERSLLAMSILSGRICEILKKSLRDNNGHLGPGKKDEIIEALAKILHNMLGTCGMLNMEPEEIMNLNIEKLFSRKERGLLGGSGDNR